MNSSPQQQWRFLVIKLGGLDEFVQATGAFKAIREHNKEAHITLLTSGPFVEMAKRTGWFDSVVEDKIIVPWNIRKYLAFIKKMKNARFRGIYDLQNSPRTEWYFRLIGKYKPDWNGHISWCSHPYLPVDWEKMHILDRQEGQLAAVGITPIPPLDISFITSDIAKFQLPPRYALLFPAGTPYDSVPYVRAGGKDIPLPTRWPNGGFAEVAQWLARAEITPVFIGSMDEKALVDDAVNLCQGLKVINLAGEVSISDIAELARHAQVAIGNDTEPMWLVSAAGCPTVFIFPEFAGYRQRVPRAQNVRVAAENDLSMLAPREVVRLAGELLPLDSSKESAKPAASGAV